MVVSALRCRAGPFSFGTQRERRRSQRRLLLFRKDGNIEQLNSVSEKQPSSIQELLQGQARLRAMREVSQAPAIFTSRGECTFQRFYGAAVTPSLVGDFRVPDDLAERDQWLLWRYEERNGRPSKVPYQVGQRRASSTNRHTWASFEAVANEWRFGELG